MAADIENHVGLLYKADYTICLLKDLKTLLLEIFLRNHTHCTIHDLLIYASIIRELVEGCFARSSIHHLDFRVINAIHDSFNSDIARTLTIPSVVVICAIYYPKPYLRSHFYTLHVNEVALLLQCI